MHRKLGAVAVLIAGGLTGAADADNTPSSVTLGVQPSYFEGDYGTGQDTEIIYVPVYAKYRSGNVSFKLTVPYLWVKSEGVIVSGGTVVGTRGGGTTTATKKSGLGDIWIESRYRFRGTGAGPDISPYVKVKFGTASYSDGLGTGKNDYEGGVGIEWIVGRNTFPFLDVGYRYVGSPPDRNLRNIAAYEGGSTFRVDEHDFLSAIFSGHESTEAGFANSAEILLAWNYETTPGNGTQLYVDKGLTDGSPRYGIGVSAYTRF
jgi:hypothetical protein